jgi:nucleoside-diphosphate-sugar epimerase
VVNVVFMTGRKFGSTSQEPLTWAMNVYLPAAVCRRFSNSRIVAFSSGNVYGLSPVGKGGSTETDDLRPVGEYAMSCLGRERMFEYFSQTLLIPMAILRLNYATEMRYGVLVDLARTVAAGAPVNLAMGHVNVIWQGDANAAAVQAFTRLATPPLVLNVAGPEILSVRNVCEQFGDLLGKPPRFTGTEAPDALLNNASQCHHLFGPPRVGADQLIAWTAEWVRRGGPFLDKPTHFEARDGKF